MKLNIEIGAILSGLNKGIADAKSRIKGLAGAFKSATGGLVGGLVGAGSVAALGAYTKKAIDFADSVADGSKKIGVSAEEYQKLSFAAEQSGTSIGTIEGAFRKMFKVLESDTAGETLGKLGLSLAELKGLSPEEKFSKIGSALAGISDKATAAAYAQEIFGKSGMELLPMLQNYKDLAAEAENIGAIISNEAVAAADQFNDSINKIGTSIQASLLNSGILNWLTDIAGSMEEVAKARKLIDSTGMTNKYAKDLKEGESGGSTFISGAIATAKAAASGDLSYENLGNKYLEGDTPGEKIRTEPTRPKDITGAKIKLDEKNAQNAKQSAEQQAKKIQSNTPDIFKEAYAIDKQIEDLKAKKIEGTATLDTSEIDKQIEDLNTQKISILGNIDIAGIDRIQREIDTLIEKRNSIKDNPLDLFGKGKKNKERSEIDTLIQVKQSEIEKKKNTSPIEETATYKEGRKFNDSMARIDEGIGKLKDRIKTVKEDISTRRQEREAKEVMREEIKSLDKAPKTKDQYTEDKIAELETKMNRDLTDPERDKFAGLYGKDWESQQKQPNLPDPKISDSLIAIGANRLNPNAGTGNTIEKQNNGLLKDIKTSIKSIDDKTKFVVDEGGAIWP